MNKTKGLEASHLTGDPIVNSSLAGHGRWSHPRSIPRAVKAHLCLRPALATVSVCPGEHTLEMLLFGTSFLAQAPLSRPVLLIKRARAHTALPAPCPRRALLAPTPKHVSQRPLLSLRRVEETAHCYSLKHSSQSVASLLPGGSSLWLK